MLLSNRLPVNGFQASTAIPKKWIKSRAFHFQTSGQTRKMVRRNLIHNRNKLFPKLAKKDLLMVEEQLNRISFSTVTAASVGDKRSNYYSFSSVRYTHTESTQEANARRKKEYQDKFIRFWTLVSIPMIFFAVFGRVHYNKMMEEKQSNHNDEDDEEVHPTSWKIFFYQALPLNAISRLWGKFNNIELPVFLREPGYKFYSYVFGVNLDEIKVEDLSTFKNLGEFFYRELKTGARIISYDSDVVCPSDGKVLSLGKIAEDGKIEQVKGMNYSVKKFLGFNNNRNVHGELEHVINDIDEDEYDNTHRHKKFAEINGISYTVDDLLGVNENKQMHHFLKSMNVVHRGDQLLITDKFDNTNTLSAAEKESNELELIKELSEPEIKDELKSPNELHFAVIYLAPGDYHRFHSPANWVVQCRKYFTGELYSVAPIFQKNFPNLFVLNERVSLLGYWKHGFFSVTPVGATNVGSIKVNFDKDLVTNGLRSKLKDKAVYEASYFKNDEKLLGGIPLVKGNEMGGFQLGSTVVLVFEAPRDDFQFKIKEGDIVRMGQPLGIINNSN